MEEQKEQRQIQKRAVAVRISINDILTGNFFRDENNVGYLLTQYGDKATRINLISGVLVKNVEDKSIIVDDGTDQILVRSFDNPVVFDNINAGDIVNLVCRVREFNNTLYLSLELLKKLNSLSWLKVRQLENEKNARLKLAFSQNKEIPTNPKDNPEEKITASPKNILDTIKQLDAGHGVSILELIKKYGDGIKEELDYMVKKGDIFELRSGVVKVLE